MTLNYAVVKLLRSNKWVVRSYDKLPVDAYENVIAVFNRKIDAETYAIHLNELKN